MHISIATWNISKALPSYSAPATWKEKWATENRLSIQNTLNHNNPDILAIQEIPDPQWLPNLVSFSEYTPIGSAASHCGYSTLLIKRRWIPHVKKSYRIGPAVVGVLILNNQQIAIASMHLYPGKEGGVHRKQQLEAVIRFCEQHDIAHWILAGDMNMRTAEEHSIEMLPASDALIDIWKMLGHTKNRWTWDSYQNHYHPKRHPFRARFDRIYLRSSILKPIRFERIGDQPLENPHHFSSDHFGLWAVFGEET